jgi:hypothetical protein
VRNLFDWVLTEAGGKAITREIRVSNQTGNNSYVHSFLCFRTSRRVPFLLSTPLSEVRYGFLLLIERRGHLAVFHRGATGFDDPLVKSSRPVSRSRLTHIWSTAARYQKFTTRRMTIAKQDLRGASYEADDLEMALIPALAARSILQSIRMDSPQHGVVAVTPSTGRVQRSAGKTDIGGLLHFVDLTIDGLAVQHDSEFLKAFPEPVELAGMPVSVVPTGLLFDISTLHELLCTPDRPYTLRADAGKAAPEVLMESLSEVLNLRTNGNEWEAINQTGHVLGQLKKLKHAYKITAVAAQGYFLRSHEGDERPLDQWLQLYGAYSLCFSDSDYFYSDDKLYRKAGFAREIATVSRHLIGQQSLDNARSEKGPSRYPPGATNFAADSIFRILETSLSVNDRFLWCCDLGDEWADYIGLGSSEVTFYHCKSGRPTSGASSFQIVIGQALKNLSRVKFRRDEVVRKIAASRQRSQWGATQIPLLARSVGGWNGFENELLAAIEGPTMRWQVAIVVTALSKSGFEAEARQGRPTPHFVQLVWLLSAFISACRERDAHPLLYCRS